MAFLIASHRTSLIMGFCALAVVACGGTATTSGDHGSSGSGSSSGGALTGGTTSGGASTGGVSTGGFGAVAVGSCSVDGDCVAVLDAQSPCYSPECSVPFGASLSDVERNPCLVLWDQRRAGIPAGCGAVGGEDIACPESCIEAPLCVVPQCRAGTCVVESRYEGDACPLTCEPASAARIDALAAAMACNPTVSSIQCDGSALVPDQCGCLHIANEKYPDLVEAAKAAYDAWAGVCPTPPCLPDACLPLGSAGYCSPEGVCVSK